MESWKEDEGETHDGSNLLVLVLQPQTKEKYNTLQNHLKEIDSTSVWDSGSQSSRFLFRQDQREAANVEG